MMKSIKRGMAVLLSVLLMVPAQPVAAAKEAEGIEVGNEAASTELQIASPSDADDSSEKYNPIETKEKASPDSAKKPDHRAEDEVIFNTGHYASHIVSREDSLDREPGDGYFEEDGSYTIEIPEDNPFFPYEVQFTYDGKTTSEWFMSPDDAVEVGGHKFFVSAHFDNTILTQMTLGIAGESVVVYPEKKKFTDNNGVMPMSLLPLEERVLNVDLTGFTPVELTRVSIDQIFTGTDALESGDQVVWTCTDSRDGENDYTVSTSGDVINLSYAFTSGSAAKWEMIVGSGDQLDKNNIRYLVNLKKTDAENWLIPQIYTEDDAGNRKRIDVVDYGVQKHINYAFGYDSDPNHFLENFITYIPSGAISDGDKAYIKLEVNREIFPTQHFDHLKVYNELFRSIHDVSPITDITDEIFCADMTAPGEGLLTEMINGPGLNTTIVAFDSFGNEIGCLPLNLFVWERGNSLDIKLVSKSENGRIDVDETVGFEYRNGDGSADVTITLKHGYPVDDEYFLFMKEHKEVDHKQEIVAVYKGLYSSLAEANAAGAEDIKDKLFSSDYSTGGLGADFSQGVYITVFDYMYEYDITVPAHHCFTTKKWAESLGRNTYVSFCGLKDKNGNEIPSYIVEEDEDSYGGYNYLTILVDGDVDLTDIAPVFDTCHGLNLYAKGNISPEISGVSLHDFSDGAVQYTASAENGIDSKNYWLQVKKASRDGETLYINSLADENSETVIENGIIYSKREVVLDWGHNRIHNILLANLSLDDIPNLSVELTSEEVELDRYWSLSGLHSLAGFSTVEKKTGYGELPNLAKIRLKARNTALAGTSITGTLTIKSGSTPLLVLTLTGTVEEPGIITEEIPKAVKYVPYGTMIQNNRKYNWDTMTYFVESGTLPAGIELQLNGELYGVPLEAGDYTFTVRMRNSAGNNTDSFRTYTLIVNENTDENVESATDPGYMLIQRINDIKLDSTSDQTMVSQGMYEEFTGVYLDGRKLKSEEDYSSEAGSTRITIRNQTLKAANKPGTHTLGIEFRTKDTNALKRAAQNYKVEESGSNSNNNNNDNGGGGDSGGSSAGGSGHSGGNGGGSKKIPEKQGLGHWQQDEKGWRWIYADGSFACGYTIEQADGSSVVQAAWEKVNGAWYAFGSDGYLLSGWVCDFQLNLWYFMTRENGMKTGWYYDDQDCCTYYLDPETGAIATGWRQIDGNWYYFTETSLASTWHFDEEKGGWIYDTGSRNKPYGSMYHSERTPDGYYVGENGVWKQ